MTLSEKPNTSPNPILLGLAMAFFIAFLVTGPLTPYLFAFAVKGGGIVLLALIAFLSGAPRAKILALGLLFGSGGDIALEQGVFELGLVSFLIGHLIYLGLFVQVIRERGARSGWPRLAVLTLPLLAVALLVWLWPELQSLAIPVSVYLLVIVVMTALAILAPFQSTRVAIGALSFVISDSLIAITKFGPDISGSDQTIWILYFMAQYLILTGFLKGWEQREP